MPARSSNAYAFDRVSEFMIPLRAALVTPEETAKVYALFDTAREKLARCMDRGGGHLAWDPE